MITVKISKKQLAVILIPVLLLAGFATYRTLHSETPAYMTVKPQVRDIVKQVFATGTVEGKTQVDVGAQASGQILKLHVSTGDEVKKGDLLCEIDPRNQENALKSAESEVEITKAQIAAKKAEIRKLKSEALRNQKLRKTDAVSAQDYETAQANLDIARAQLEQYEAQLKKNEVQLSDAKTNLGYTSITAPMDGTVYATVVDEGQTVNASQTTPTILRLADLSEVTVKTEISEADVVNVKSGMECSFTILGRPHEVYRGVLGRIEPAPSSYASSSSTQSTSSSSSSSSSQNAVYYNADIIVKNPDGVLRIDMTADVTVNVASAKKVLSLPLTALREDYGNEGQIYVLDKDGLVKAHKVKLGLRDDQYVQLEDGLDEHAQVVIGDDVSTAESQALNNSRGPKRML